MESKYKIISLVSPFANVQDALKKTGRKAAGLIISRVITYVFHIREPQTITELIRKDQIKIHSKRYYNNSNKNTNI